MRRTTIVVSLLLAPVALLAQDSARAVAGGGVLVPGWRATLDPKEAAVGQAIANAKFGQEGDALHVTTGPAITYWNPSNTASGNYTVKATFREPKYMALNNHPHPYGIVVAGNDMGTPQESYLYCAAYGDGRFIARGFGPAPFQLNGRGTPNPAVNKAAGPGEPVTQEIAVTVRGDVVECAINGTVVGSWNRSELVVPGRLKATDGIYGLRFAHNTEAFVTGLSLSRAIPVTK